MQPLFGAGERRVDRRFLPTTRSPTRRHRHRHRGALAGERRHTPARLTQENDAAVMPARHADLFDDVEQHGARGLPPAIRSGTIQSKST
jgi:hypothetical protein